MDKISHVLPKVLQRRGLKDHAQGAHATHAARKWFESHLPHIAPFIGDMKIVETALHISCSHSIALQECQAQNAHLIEYLRLECPFGGIKEVRYTRS
jgi:hypothetical protein